MLCKIKFYLSGTKFHRCCSNSSLDFSQKRQPFENFNKENVFSSNTEEKILICPNNVCTKQNTKVLLCHILLLHVLRKL